MKKGIGFTLSMVAAQTVSLFPFQASAAELQFDGTTQIASTDYCLDADAFLSELEIEEVYVEADSQIEEGGQILKLTDESYQKAVKYYEAAIIRAEGTLTDTKMEYEQGLLDAQYTYELAQQKAEQAEFVREYQSRELEDTIAEHEEILEEIEARIAELEAGIADGSYSQQSGGTSAGAGASGSGGQTQSRSESDSEQESEEQSETQPGSGDEAQSENQSQSETQPGPGDEAQSENQSQSETQPESGDETQSESQSGSETQPGDGTVDQTETAGRIEELKVQIEENNQLYQSILTRLGEIAGVNMESGAAEEVTDWENGAESSSGTADTDQSQLISWLQESITGDGNVKTNLQNVRTNLNSVPDQVLEVIKEAYPDYQNYVELLSSCIAQLETDISLQQNVMTALGEMDTAEGGETEGTLDAKEIQTLLVQLSQAETQRSSLYGELLAAYAEYIAQLSEAVNLPGETEEPGTAGGSGNDLASGTDSVPESEEQDGNSGDSEAPGGSSSGGEEPDGSSGDSEAPDESSSDGEVPDGMPDMSGKEASVDVMTGGQALAGGMMGAGASGGTQGGVSGSGAFGTAASDGALQSETLAAENLGLLEEDISLFGDTYDLTQTVSLIEREPSDNEDAYDLIDQLEDAGTTVEEQYAELQRNEHASELLIQYTYDSAIIEGKLAEITYRQEVQEWEETLAEAETEKKTLEDGKEILDSFENGIVSADRSGTIASVSCEAGDSLEGGTPVVSYYDTDKTEVVIEVSQNDIAAIAVGDAAEVEIAGAGTVEAAVTEKSPEAESGTSRTTVNYLVTVSMDNENGRLSQGLSASVTITGKAEADEAAGTDSIDEKEMEE